MLYLDAAILQVEHALLRRIELGQNVRLLLQRDLVPAFDRPPHDLDLVLDLLVELVDRRFQLLHLRERRLVDPQLVLVLDLLLGPFLLQRRNRLVVDHLRRGFRVLLELLIERLGAQPLLAGLRRCLVVRGKRLRQHVLLLVDVDDLLRALELRQRALGFLQPRLGLRELLLEEGLRVRRRVVAALQVDRDEVLGECVERVGGELGIGRVEVHAHQPRIADRVDEHRAHERAHREPVRITRTLGRTLRCAPVTFPASRVRPQDREPPWPRPLIAECDVAQVQLLDDALGQRAALQQLVLRAVEVDVAVLLGRNRGP